jgi:hypothetical protein
LEAVESVLAQTFKEWELFVIDSGILFKKGFFHNADPRVGFFLSKETKKIKKQKNIASWCFNKWITDGPINGEFIVYLSDDDLLYPGAFQAYYDYHQAHPDTLAMYGHCEFSGKGPDGREMFHNEIRADKVRGKGSLFCEVDGGQVCYAVKLLEGMIEPWPESLEDGAFADGLHLEKIGALTSFHPVDAKVAHNRKFCDSKNQGVALRLMAPSVWGKDEIEKT